MQGYQQPMSQPGWSPQPSGGVGVQLESGVVQFMNGVYAWMAAGLTVTAATAYGLSLSPETLLAIFGSPLRWVAMLAPLAFVWFFAGRVQSMTPGMAGGMFVVFSALMGVSLAPIGLMAQLAPGLVASAFVITAGSFFALALFGWATKRDLSGLGSFAFMALFGLIIASLINVFVQSVQISLGISAISVLVFAAFTAYDVQNIKQIYLMQGGRGNLAIVGALELYLDFLNLFLSILRLLSAFGGSDD
jgi:FtsH-binding integral membrane protein